MKSLRIKAFTLAEVLITLTIIGVIATLTIPNLMQSYRKHQVEVGVKEAYSILSNAIKMSEAENGPLTETLVDNLNVNEWSKQYIQPYLKGKEIYKTTDGATAVPYRRDKFGKFEYHFFKSIEGVEQNNGVGNQGGMNIIALDNGMWLNVIWANDYKSMNFIMDINGFTDPNQYGIDVFAFSYFPPNDGYYKNPGGILHAGTVFGGFEAHVKIPDNAYNYCVSRGDMCAALIQRNGWKIPDNYPVKKW